VPILCTPLPNSLWRFAFPLPSTRTFGLDDGFRPKPKGMHWRTYRCLEQLDEDLAGRWRCSVAGYLERLDRKTFNGKASALRR
jgi:hypothetical protein